MITASSRIQRSVYAAVAIVAAIGFVVQFWLLFTGGSDANSGESGGAVPLVTRFIRLFSFFTIASNVLVLVAAVAGAMGRGRSVVGRTWYLAALLSIAVTGSAFSFLLDPSLTLRGPAQLVTNLFHIVSPILFVVAWILWGPRRSFSWRIALAAFVWPIVWLAYTFIHGAITDWYPYALLDAGARGLPSALGGAGVVLAFGALLLLIVLAIDRWAPALPTSPMDRSLG